MKKQPLFVLMQPEVRNAYWADHIRNGIRDGAHQWNDTICSADPSNSAVDLSGQHVLVAGNDINWLEASISTLMHLGAHPVIVNACMLPVRQFRCSGVVFELEEALGKCLDLLKASGRKNTVLLGANPHSVTDHVKANAFLGASSHLSEDSIIWAEESLDRCIAEFSEHLDRSECDSVICANDTAAICLSRCLTSLGYRLPEQLFIIGMGNSYVGAGMKKALTSVMFDYYEMGLMAVRLYHNLRQTPINYHSTMSLPCRLIIRDSAPLNDADSVPSIPHASDHLSNAYFESDVIRNIIQAEAMLQAGDPADREILLGILRGESCAAMAEKLFFSDRTVRYRLNKLVRQYGFQNRTELEMALRYAVGEETNTKGGFSW